MKRNLLAALVVVLILLIGIFLLVPNAFSGIVPSKYIPKTNESSEVPIHWIERSAVPEESDQVSAVPVTEARDVTEEQTL